MSGPRGPGPVPASPSLEPYEAIVGDLVEALRSGDPAALQRLMAHTGRDFAADELRAVVAQRLGRAPEAGTASADITLADARRLVARLHGLTDWDELEERVATTPGASAAASAIRAGIVARVAAAGTARPELEPYAIDPAAAELKLRRRPDSKDEDAVLGAMAERRLAAVSADGHMTDSLLARLARLEAITSLDLSGSARVTDDGLRHLANLPRLRRLDLSGCSLTDRGLEVLRSLTALRSFQLIHDPRVSDAGLAHLAGCPHLERVALMGTRAGDGVIRALAGKPELRRFLSGRDVTDDGLAALREFPAFAAWRGGEIDFSLMEFEAGPTYLLIDGRFTDPGLAALAGLDGLFALNLGDPPAVTAAGLAPLAGMRNLGWLGCTGDLCDDEAMRHIGGMPRLRMLMAQDNVSGDAGFIALSRSRTLECIWGRRCHNLTGRGFAALAGMPALRGLSVSCRNVGDEALSALPRFPALTSFMPMDVADAGFRHVGRCPRLEALWCMYCRDSGDVATAHIAALPRLRTYYAGHTRITDRGLEILGGMISLEHVTLFRCFGITDAGIAHLARLPRLREAALEGLPHVTAEGAAVFRPAVRVSYVR